MMLYLAVEYLGSCSGAVRFRGRTHLGRSRMSGSSGAMPPTRRRTSRVVWVSMPKSCISSSGVAVR